MMTLKTHLPRMTLVIGGTGKTGLRVAQPLWNARGSVRLGYRGGEPRFDWADASTWAGALAGASAAYVTYHPDLLYPRRPTASAPSPARRWRQGRGGWCCCRAAARTGRRAPRTPSRSRAPTGR